MSGAQDTASFEPDPMARFKASIPPLDGRNYKGQHGKVGVIGGCSAYTGAPFFAAQSAHKVGADMTYVICTPGAASVIKGYSPDMIVLPLLMDNQEKKSFIVEQHLGEFRQTWLPRMTVLVVGPGLGEESGPQHSAAQIIKWAREAGLPMVIDGSAISTVASNPSLVKGYQRCILTPNIAELGRLAAAVGVQLNGKIGSQWQAQACDVAAAWNGPILVSKGPEDVISDGRISMGCAQPGSNKRCGGIGDVLAGTMGTFLGWQRSTLRDGAGSDDGSMLAAALAACALVRRASAAAYEEHGRAMGAGDVLSHLPAQFRAIFGP